MIFNEIYSAYYNAVAKILSELIEGNRDERSLNKIVNEKAFGESMLTILPALKNEKWQLAHSDLTTAIKHKPTMPLTNVEKRWLKSISLDPRIQLFGIELKGLENVEPLFTAEDYYIYDKYADGDPYSNPDYIKRFRIILKAIRDKTALSAQVLNRRDKAVEMNFIPKKIEYSEKDDKFRLITVGCRYGGTINLARILSVTPIDAQGFAADMPTACEKRTVTLKILDERNTLERAMLHFAHFEKQAERLDNKHYLVNITYNKEDETELVIRVLGFGPLIEVVEPLDFRQLIIDRLKKQISCELF